MSTDERSENERWYDEEIAPALLDIGRRLEERGMSIVASVEYEPGERGSTKCIAEDAGLPMHLLSMLDLAGQNIDGFIIGVIRHCRANNIDTSSSIALTRWSKP